MVKRIEVSFAFPNNIVNTECTLHHIPSYKHIFNANFENIYLLATSNQRKKLDKLKTDRNLEIVINLNLNDLRLSKNKG